MDSSPWCLRWQLPSVCAAVVALLAGCETAAPPPSENVASSMGPVLEAAKSNDLPPLVVFAGEERDRNFDPHFEIPLSTVSPERRGPVDAPFDFIRTRQQLSESGAEVGQVFPLNNRTGNLLFYRDVGIPQLTIEKLDEEHIRIWARVQNRTEDDIRVRVTCMGREAISTDDRYDYEAIIFRRNVYRDFSFVMTGDEARRFTLAITGVTP